VSNFLIKYKNGNIWTYLYKDGTKVRQYDDIAKPEHPESIDLKITDFCDLGCSFCHEESSTSGEHANIDKLERILMSLPAGVELAIGGGNPLAHPQIKQFLTWANMNGFICNLTVNYHHLDMLDNIDIKQIKSLGVSLPKNLHDIDFLKLSKIPTKIVVHLILGVHKKDVIEACVKFCDTILFLGSKDYGKGRNFRYDRNSIIYVQKNFRRFIKNSLICLDNKAVKQIGVSILRSLPEVNWNECYMGEDGKFTMYIDAINQNYSKNSTSNDRVSWDLMNIANYFKDIRSEPKI